MMPAPPSSAVMLAAAAHELRPLVRRVLAPRPAPRIPPLRSDAADASAVAYAKDLQALMLSWPKSDRSLTRAQENAVYDGLAAFLARPAPRACDYAHRRLTALRAQLRPLGVALI